MDNICIECGRVCGVFNDDGILEFVGPPEGASADPALVCGTCCQTYNETTGGDV